MRTKRTEYTFLNFHFFKKFQFQGPIPRAILKARIIHKVLHPQLKLKMKWSETTSISRFKFGKTIDQIVILQNVLSKFLFYIIYEVTVFTMLSTRSLCTGT